LIHQLAHVTKNENQKQDFDEKLCKYLEVQMTGTAGGVVVEEHQNYWCQLKFGELDQLLLQVAQMGTAHT
jgi:hypothetical protein